MKILKLKMGTFILLIAFIWIFVFGHFGFYKISAIGGMLLILAMIFSPVIFGGSSGGDGSGRDIEDD